MNVMDIRFIRYVLLVFLVFLILGMIDIYVVFFIYFLENGLPIWVLNNVFLMSGLIKGAHLTFLMAFIGDSLDLILILCLNSLFILLVVKMFFEDRNKIFWCLFCLFAILALGLFKFLMSDLNLSKFLLTLLGTSFIMLIFVFLSIYSQVMVIFLIIMLYGLLFSSSVTMNFSDKLFVIMLICILFFMKIFLKVKSIISKFIEEFSEFRKIVREKIKQLNYSQIFLFSVVLFLLTSLGSPTILLFLESISNNSSFLKKAEEVLKKKSNGFCLCQIRF